MQDSNDTSDISASPSNVLQSIEDRYKSQKSVSFIGSDTILVLSENQSTQGPSVVKFASQVFENMVNSVDNQSITILYYRLIIVVVQVVGNPIRFPSCKSNWCK